jgi:outer membrane cobalamin receptor
MLIRVAAVTAFLFNSVAPAEPSPELEFVARVENLLGQNYEDVYTYRTPGRGFFIGPRATH